MYSKSLRGFPPLHKEENEPCFILREHIDVVPLYPYFIL